MVGPTRNEVLALVPARGGSKSIPRKNLAPLGGHPLIAYSIAAAQSAASVTRVIVSTDDPEIADVAVRYGAEVPFLRPRYLALDSTPDLPVFQHVLDWLFEHEGHRPDVVVHLRPTTPFRPRHTIDEAVARLIADPEADCVRAVTRPSQNPFKMWKDGDAGSMVPLLGSDLPEPYNMPRQELPPVYWQTGHVDAIRTSTILDRRSMTGRRILPAHFDPALCVDIDTEADLQYARWLLENGMPEIVRPSTPIPHAAPAVRPHVNRVGESNG